MVVCQSEPLGGYMASQLPTALERAGERVMVRDEKVRAVILHVNEYLNQGLKFLLEYEIRLLPHDCAIAEYLSDRLVCDMVMNAYISSGWEVFAFYDRGAEEEYSGIIYIRRTERGPLLSPSRSWLPSA